MKETDLFMFDKRVIVRVMKKMVNFIDGTYGLAILDDLESPESHPDSKY